MPRTF